MVTWMDMPFKNSLVWGLLCTIIILFVVKTITKKCECGNKFPVPFKEVLYLLEGPIDPV